MKNKQQVRLRVGDSIKVISGKDKGKISEILSINKKKKTVVVKGVNIAIKHVRPKSQDEPGEIMEMEKPVNISNIMYSDSETTTRLGYRLYSKEGTNKKIKVRYQKRTNTDLNK